LLIVFPEMVRWLLRFTPVVATIERLPALNNPLLTVHSARSCERLKEKRLRKVTIVRDETYIKRYTRGRENYKKNMLNREDFFRCTAMGQKRIAGCFRVRGI
jgi:hypothetical protein